MQGVEWLLPGTGAWGKWEILIKEYKVSVKQDKFFRCNEQHGNYG